MLCQWWLVLYLWCRFTSEKEENSYSSPANTGAGSSGGGWHGGQRRLSSRPQYDWKAVTWQQRWTEGKGISIFSTGIFSIGIRTGKVEIPERWVSQNFFHLIFRFESNIGTTPWVCNLRGCTGPCVHCLLSPSCNSYYLNKRPQVCIMHWTL